MLERKGGTAYFLNRVSVSNLEGKVVQLLARNQVIMTQEYNLFIESSVRGYHAYYKNVVVHIGEVLYCETENDNEYDQHAVVVTTEDGKTVGHVPIKLSEIFNAFLADYGTIEAECIGNRCNRGGGKGLEIPVDYKLISGSPCYLRKVLKKLSKKESTQDLNSSGIMNIQSVS